MASLPSPPRGPRPFDVVGLGENSVDHVCLLPQPPTPGGKIRLASHRVMGGGQVATALVACQRLGLRTRYFGKVGEDAPGLLALEELRREGVDVSSVRRVAGAQTSLSYVLVDASTGERTVLWDHDPMLLLRPDEISREEIASGRLLHLDVTAPETSLRAAGWAREEGLLTCLDMDHVPEGAERLLPLIDLCIVSSNVPQELTGIADLEQALRQMRRLTPAPFLCVTLGAQGAVALVGDVLLHSPGFAVRAVDTTACGDVFHAAAIYGALAGWDVERTMRFANGAAALKTRALGGRPGIPTLEEVETFLTIR